MMNIKEKLNTTVWVIEDDLTSQSLLSSFFIKKNISYTLFSSTSEALEKFKKSTLSMSLILTDLMMEGMDGIEFASEVKKICNHVPVIVITGQGSIHTAVRAIKMGVFDYVLKPFQWDEFEMVIERALRLNQLNEENHDLRKQIHKNFCLEDIIGKSPGMQNVFRLIERVSHFSASVLIQGESGTGKEVVARAIHNLSSQRNNHFIPVNCAAIPDQLLESELFGHSKGSFTGATYQRIGLFEQANHGTIFLDEIGDMPLSLQVKLLRVIQEKKIKPIGENSYKPIHVRVISATHRNLEKMVKEGTFREDLFYRLNVLPIFIPPLRDRIEDIPLLVDYFSKKHSLLNKTPKKQFSKEILCEFSKYLWPGNVRELENVIERAIILSESEKIELESICFKEDESKKKFAFLTEYSKPLSLEIVEKNYIEYVLIYTGGRKDLAAEILQIDPKTLYRKIKNKS